VAKQGEPLRVDARVAAGVLVLLTVIAFGPGFGGGFIWDDDAHVTDSRPVVDPGGLRAIWLEPGSVPQYYPLTHSSFWLEYRFWGDNPLGYHAVNILLHAVSVLVLWRVLVGLGLPGAWLAAAFFAVHPVHAESVVWISERKNTLSGLFALASTWAWLGWWRAERGSVTGTGTGTGTGRWWLALLLFAAALLSKTVTVTVPAAWLVICWWQGGRIGRREWLGVLPMLLLTVPMGLMTVWTEQQHIGAGRLDLGLTVPDRLQVAGRALWFYAGKLAWPNDLAFIYPRWSIDSASFTGWLYPLGAMAVIGLLWWGRGRIGRGPLAAVLLFAGTLAPALGFVDVYPMQFSFVADHFQYLASIPLLSGAAWLIVTRWYASHGIALVLVLVGVSFVHSRVFLDTSILWSDTVKKNPRSPLALTSLGNVLGEAGSHELAERRHRQAIEVDPRFPDAWVNLAVELQSQGRKDEAFEAAGRAVELAPWLPRARVNLALGLAERERYDEAVEQLEAAVDSDSRFSMAWAQLARIELIRNNAAGLKRAVEGLRPLDRGLAERFAREFEQTRPHNDVPSP
jgi:Tfp pilus assembly protein PilF